MSRQNGNGYRPRLKERYDDELRARLKDDLGVSTVMQVPRVSKITLNMGVGEAKTDAKALDSAIEELTTIAGQRAQVRRARKSIAELQAARGNAGRRARDAARRPHVGVPRPARVDRAAADPRLPRPQPAARSTAAATSRSGSASRSSSRRSTTTTSDTIRGLDVAITTTAEDDEQALALLRALGMPFTARSRAPEGESKWRRNA